MKKLLIILAILVLVVSVFAACNPTSSSAIRITKPSGGEVLVHGDSMEIVFSVKSGSGVTSVNIELWKGTEADGSAVETVESGLAVTDDGEDITENWTIPATLSEDGTDYHIKISNADDETVYGFSSAFSIYETPPTANVTFTNENNPGSAAPNDGESPIPFTHGHVIFGPGEMLGYNPDADISGGGRYLTPDNGLATGGIVDVGFDGDSSAPTPIRIGEVAYFTYIGFEEAGNVAGLDSLSTYLYGYFNYLDDYQFEDPTADPPGDWTGYELQIDGDYTFTFNHDTADANFGWTIDEQ
jgi:hypothetical protein